MMKMDKKYVLTDETKTFLGRILHRIQAVRDFGDVKAGDLGGWIEKEYELAIQLAKIHIKGVK